MRAPTGFLSPKLLGRVIEAPSGRPEIRGVFARSAVHEGEVLAVWGGEVITSAEVCKLRPDELRLTLQIDEDAYILSGSEGPADWVNHSCEPNAGLRGQIVLVAMRNIRPGEQVCFDYAMSDGSDYDEFECSCGSKLCRRKVTGADWRKKSLWQRYDGYFSPYLSARISALRAQTAARTRRVPARMTRP